MQFSITPQASGSDCMAPALSSIPTNPPEAPSVANVASTVPAKTQLRSSL